MATQVESTEDAVVVPGIEAPSSTACVRSLGKRGVRTIVVSEDEDTPAFYSKYCDETVVAPDPGEDLEGYGDLLVDLASRESVRTIIPVREPDVYNLATRRDEFAAHVATPWPDAEQLEVVRDRVRLFEAAEAADVSVPETKLLTEWDDWDRETIVKSRYTVLVSEDGAAYPSVRYNEPGETPDVDRIVDEMDHDPLVQAYMPDPAEYAYFGLFDHGEELASFQHRQIRAYKYSGGPSAFRESVQFPELAAAGRGLLEELDWHGLAMVEFKRDDGEFKLMEINPRFWSSLPFSVSAGADFPSQYYRLATGESVEDDGYDLDAAGHLIRGEVGYLLSTLAHESPLAERPHPLGAASEVLGSVLEYPRFDYLHLDDPGPFVQDVRRTLQQGIGRRL